jgi:hypothetical protein
MRIFNTDRVAGVRPAGLARIVKQDHIHKAVLKSLGVAWGDVSDDQDPLDPAGTEHAVEFKELAIVVLQYPDATVATSLKQLPLHAENNATEERIVE